MQNKKNAIGLVAKIVAGATLMGVFALNMVVFTSSEGNNSSALSKVAMATLPGGGGGSVVCYSSSQDRTGSHFYDCGDCKKVDGAEGKGTSGNCTTAAI